MPPPLNFPPVDGQPVHFLEAIRAAGARHVVLPEVYYGQLQGVARQLAFSIAGIASHDQLKAVMDSLSAWQANGKTFAQWQREAAVKDLELPRYRLENIFRTNLQGNYQAGHWEQIIRNQQHRPYLMYDAINDSRTRPAHRAMDNIIRPIDDVFWKTHSPPNGYMCRCGVISLTEAQAQARSKDGTGLNKVIDETTMQPDKGWGYSPRDRLQGIEQATAKRLEKGGVLSSELIDMQELAQMTQIAPYRQDWPENFPGVILNAGLGDAAKHPYYLAAKGGDLNAAARLVEDLINPNAVKALMGIIGAKKPLLIPVHAEESVSINQIPLAYAVNLGQRLGLPVETTIVQSAKVNRTGADGFSRLAFPPPFSGRPSQEAQFAIILDDTLTQGGTLANLMGYVAQFNIKTIAATTLTGKNYSSVLALSAPTLLTLRKDYAELEHWWISFFGYDFSHLTESEARYLINSKKDANTIRDRIIAERQAGVF